MDEQVKYASHSENPKFTTTPEMIKKLHAIKAWYVGFEEVVWKVGASTAKCRFLKSNSFSICKKGNVCFFRGNKGQFV